MRKLLFLCYLISFSFTQEMEIGDRFIIRSHKYFESRVVSENVQSPYSSEALEELIDHVNETDVRHLEHIDQVYFYHYLYRFLLESNYGNAVTFGLKSFKLAESLPTKTPESLFIEGYYQYHSSKLGAFQKLNHLFENLHSDKESGIKKILTPLKPSSSLYLISLNDQFNSLLEAKKDYLAAVPKLEKLLKKFPQSSRILKEYMNIIFETGDFETAIEVLLSLVHKSSTESERARMFSYLAECYFFLGYDDISTQYFYQSIISDTLLNKGKAYLCLAKMTYLTEQPDSISLSQYEFWLEEYAENNEFNNWYEFKQFYNTPSLKLLKQADFLLNRSDRTQASKCVQKLQAKKEDENERFKKLFMLTYGKLLWLEKDYFNAKRYLHNLKNTFPSLEDEVVHMLHLILADIAYHLNDFEQCEEYLSSIDLDLIPFYYHHTYYFLEIHLKEFN